MAAITRARQVQTRNLGAPHKLKMAAEKIWAGALVMMNAAGYLANAAANASNAGCWGIAQETVDNSGGAAGDKEITIQECEVLLDATSIAVGDNGSPVYASDNHTIDETQGANEPRAGILVEFVSSTSGWVKVGIATAS